VEIGDGFIRLQPDDASPAIKLEFRWKVRFSPPKFPVVGDRAMVLYKTKENSLIIYGINYLKQEGKGAASSEKIPSNVR